MKDEALLLAIENRIAQDVGRQQVAGELNPLKGGADRPGQCLRKRRLTNSGNILDQQMTAREQARERNPQRIGFADDHSGKLLQDSAEALGHRNRRLRKWADSHEL